MREKHSAQPITTNPENVARIFPVLMRWRGGALIPAYALLYFADIRPLELKRLAPRFDELVNLRTRTIRIPANVAKTCHERQIVICDALAAWLKAFPGPIFPTNYERLKKRVRKHFSLTPDEARHSFISYHVALHRSIGDAALQAGNSEARVKRHYLNIHPQEEGAQLFATMPDLTARRAISEPATTERPATLRAI